MQRSLPLLVVGGAALAAGLGRRLPPVPVGDAVVAVLRPIRRATVVVGGMLALADGMLRQRPVAAMSLVLVAAALGVAMLGYAPLS